MISLNSNYAKIYGLLLVLSLTLIISGSALAQGQAGTTLTAEKSAEGFWEKYIEYDWTIEKSANPTYLELGKGDFGFVDYTLTITKTQVSETEKIGVRGTITVTNGGEVITENLKLVDQVEYKIGAGQFQPLAGATQIITPPQLAPGETGSYDYEILFTPVAGAIYRNTVKVTITNHSGHLGEEFGPEPKADFSLPAEPTLIEKDKCAEVVDSAQIDDSEDSFDYTDPWPGPWTVCDSTIITYTAMITNVSAMCDSWYYLDNTATLTEKDSGTTHDASAEVEIYTLPCSYNNALTIGYWKTHAGFTGNNADRVTQYLPIWLGTAGGSKSIKITTASEAVYALSMNLGHPSNGITKLYAQLLATKLNIANGVNGASVAGVIASADTFLAIKNWTDWNSLSKANKNMVLGWMSALDNFNNGY